MKLANHLKSLRDGLASRISNVMLDRFIKSSARAGFSVLDPTDFEPAKQAYLYGAGLKAYQPMRKRNGLLTDSEITSM